MPGRAAKLLRVGIDSPVRRYYPRLSDGYTAQLICRQIFEPPFDPPVAGQASRPLLFDSPLVEEPARDCVQAYSARVRDDLRFSDGTAVTGQDVVTALSQSELGSQAEMHAEGGRVMFALRRPNANFHLALTQTDCALDTERDGEMLGTGPFRLAGEPDPEFMRLERNPHFRFDVPLEGVEFRVYPPGENGSKAPLVEALDRGEVDLTMSLTPTDAAGLTRIRKWFGPGSSIGQLYFNTRQTPFDDRRVRRAVAMGINRLDLSAAAYGNALAFAAKGPLPPMMGEWHDQYPFDIDRAQHQLDELGVTRPARLRMLLPWAPRPYLPYPEKVLEQLQGMLGRLGFEVHTVATEDLRDFRTHVLRGEYDLALLGWNADTPDPADFLEASFAPQAIPEHEDSPVPAANWSRWENDEMARLLEQFRADPTDPTQYTRGRILELLSEQMPAFPLMYGPTLSVHSYRVRNYQPHPFGIPSLAEVDLWK